MAMSQKGNQTEVLSAHSLQVESILLVAHNEEKVKTSSFMFLMFLCQKWTYLCQNAKRTTNSFACPLVNLSTRQPVNLFIRSAVNPSINVNYSVRNLTLWVPFLLTIVRLAAKNRFSRRLILMKKEGNPWMQQNEFLFKATAICTRFCAICS